MLHMAAILSLFSLFVSILFLPVFSSHLILSRPRPISPLFTDFTASETLRLGAQSLHCTNEETAQRESGFPRFTQPVRKSWDQNGKYSLGHLPQCYGPELFPSTLSCSLLSP